mmetsp:Transcript_65101/g.135709  ORF Transcript_65101/g.135709 Transcript_65101/m.135709 type:complete len:215 (-) Transcript_65101:8789-9433(-)
MKARVRPRWRVRNIHLSAARFTGSLSTRARFHRAARTESLAWRVCSSVIPDLKSRSASSTPSRIRWMLSEIMFSVLARNSASFCCRRCSSFSLSTVSWRSRSRLRAAESVSASASYWRWTSSCVCAWVGPPSRWLSISSSICLRRSLARDSSSVRFCSSTCISSTRCRSSSSSRFLSSSSIFLSSCSIFARSRCSNSSCCFLRTFIRSPFSLSS